MGPWVVYLLFFCSGISGLIYQVAWVRRNLAAAQAATRRDTRDGI